MEMNLLKRFVNIFAAFLFLSTIASGAGVNLQKEKFEGCVWDSLEKLQFDIVTIVCEEISVLQNFTEFIPEGAKVKDIHIYNADISVLVNEQLYKMSLLQLEVLSISFGNIEKIEDGAFKGGDTIRDLDMTGNAIETLDPAVFRFLINLKKLHLRDNKLKQFAENAVILNPKLLDLQLDGNKIEKLNSKLFSKLNDLSVLMLHDNQLKTLNDKIFTQSLPNLSHLSLYYNPWECDCQFVRMMKIILEKKNLRLNSYSSIFCCYEGSKINVYHLKDTKWANVSKSCTPEIINPQKPDADNAESNHLGVIFLSIGLVVGVAILAGIGFWVKKRSINEDGLVQFVTMTENED